MKKTPQKRDLNKKPLKGVNTPVSIQPLPSGQTERGSLTNKQDSKWTTCTRCNGFGGMDGSCPKCGGTGFSD